MCLKWWPMHFLIPVLYAQNLHIQEIIPTDIKPLKLNVNATFEVVLIYKDLDELKTLNPFRIKTSTNHSDSDYPVMVVTRQAKAVTSWSVPMILETTNKKELISFNRVSKIMCHDQMDDIVNSDDPEFSLRPLHVAQNFIITLSTSSVATVSIDIELEEQKDFYVDFDKTYSLAVSPSEPKYVFVKVNGNMSDTVVIRVDSDDEFCLTVSVQDSTCPVFDTNKDITFEGIHQTINLKGALTINKKSYRRGFVLVFVAKPDNYECSEKDSYIPRSMASVQFQTTNITTEVNFSIKNGVTYKQYMIAIFATLISLVLVGVICVIAALLFHRCGTIGKVPSNDNNNTEQVRKLSVMEIKTLINSEIPVVSDFARYPMKIKSRSYNYLWQTLSIAIFYSIPVVQLVVIYQRTVNLTGNQDMCYYNFLCAHPALGFSDFNHIFSNVGYIFFGALFTIVVYDRHRRICMRTEEGIPLHYGIYHAMGVALIIEGLLSACYHICPSQSNYQFDTSFMYVMAVLIMIKLYQNRHSDINATAYTTFTILGLAIFIAMVGILNGSLWVWIMFSLMYSALCVVVSFKIYYLNYVIEGLKTFKETFQQHGLCFDTFKPLRKSRFIIMLLVNMANYSMLITGLCLYNSNVTDFGTFLLGLLLGNTLIHTIFYTIMKPIHKERICLEAALYGILCVCAWIASGVFFFDAATLWTVTPAESRHWNQECIFLNFYDKHDVWHLLSAVALFLNFMFLMCLDDDLIDKKRNEIPVF